MARRRFKLKNQIIENVLVTGLADRGKGVAKDDEGNVYFVTGVAPGDIIDILVIRKKKNFFEGIVKEIKSLSKDRTQPVCEHFGSCGGCKYQHIPYEKQLEYKNDRVYQNLKRIGQIDIQEAIDILGCEEHTRYRNKMEYSFSSKRWLTKDEITNPEISNAEDVLGFHAPGSFDKVVSISNCHLQTTKADEIRNFTSDWAKKSGLPFFDARSNEGFWRSIVIRNTIEEKFMIILSTKENNEEVLSQYFTDLLAKFGETVHSLYLCINPKKNDFLLDLEHKLIHGSPTIQESLGEIKFNIGPKSFFQTNTKQAVKLYDLVVDFLALEGTENVYDLYTGLGSIALYIAAHCKQVVGIEEIASAIEDAKVNAKLNKVENSMFYAGDVKDILTNDFVMKHGKPDALITDPPRAGMHPKVVEMLLELATPKLVYVSCNPATQARDLALLSEKYNIIKTQPVDMFPHTHHVESVALLKLKK